MAAYFLNPHSIPLFLSALLMAVLGLAIFRSGKSKLNFYFAAICASVIVWLIFTAMGILVKENVSLAQLWFQIDWVGVSFISINVYAFSSTLLGLKRPKSIGMGYVIAIFFAASTLIFNPQMAGINKYTWGLFPRCNFSWNAPFLLFFFGYSVSLAS